MVLEQHKVAVKQFMDEALSSWSPFFISILKAPLPQYPTRRRNHKKEEFLRNGGE